MAEWRVQGTPCPIDEEAASLEKCLGCRFNRGASSFKEVRLLCNWPRNGSEMAVREPLPKWMDEIEQDAK